MCPTHLPCLECGPIDNRWIPTWPSYSNASLTQFHNMKAFKCILRDTPVVLNSSPCRIPISSKLYSKEKKKKCLTIPSQVVYNFLFIYIFNTYFIPNPYPKHPQQRCFKIFPTTSLTVQGENTTLTSPTPWERLLWCMLMQLHIVDSMKFCHLQMCMRQKGGKYNLEVRRVEILI